MPNIGLFPAENGALTIDFERGDFRLQPGLDSEILLLLTAQSRAQASQVGAQENRRGWLADLVPTEAGSSQGGQGWTFEQRRLTTETANGVADFAEKALQKLPESRGVKRVTVDGILSPPNGISLEINITYLTGATEKKSVNLWEITGNAI